MRFGPNLIFQCPHCGCSVKKRTLLSYTIFHARRYSDGYITGGVPHLPDLVKCTHCKQFFFLHNQKGIPDKKREHEDVASAGFPSLPQYFKALKAGTAQNTSEEIQIRLLIWRQFNGIIRSGGQFSSGEEARWTKNCKDLLRLLEQEMNENEADNALTNQDGKVVAAELNRNLGNFEAALALLEGLPEKYDHIKADFQKECGKKNRMVFMFEPQQKR
jgi:hypothetical protein